MSFWMFLFLKFVSGGSAVAKRTRAGCKRREDMPIPECHPNILWKGEDPATKKIFNGSLPKIGGRVVHSPRIVSWEVMKELGCDEFLEDMFLTRVLWDNKILTSNM